jgi:hypothetical protein
MLSNFGANCGMGFYEGDLDADGAVSMADVTLWRQHFHANQPAASAAAVPEPASTALAFVGLLAAAVLASRHRR